MFAQTRPKLAAYTHIVALGSPTIPPPTIDDMVAETRQAYDGPLVVGEDLMVLRDRRERDGAAENERTGVATPWPGLSARVLPSASPRMNSAETQGLTYHEGRSRISLRSIQASRLRLGGVLL